MAASQAVKAPQLHHALIVDEPSGFRTALSVQLAAELDAAEVLETDVEREAFRLVREHRPGLVLVDVERFGNPGIDFVRRVSATCHPASGPGSGYRC